MEAATAQIKAQFGRGGHGGHNSYRGSGINPYAGGGYQRGGRGDWYYDQYQPRRHGGGQTVGQGGGRGGGHGMQNWGAYRNPGLYAPGGPYHGYGYGLARH